MIGVWSLTPRNPYISLSPVCPRLSRLYLFPVLVVVLLKSLIFCSPTDIITMLASSEFDPLDTLQLFTGHPSAESKDLPCRIYLGSRFRLGAPIPMVRLPCSCTLTTLKELHY